MPSVNKTPYYGLNQWQGNEYPKRQDFVDDNAKIDTALKAVSDRAIFHLTCTTSNTIHALTGLTVTSGIVSCDFKADTNYVSGDMFTVNVGGTVTSFSVVTSGGESLRSGAFLANDIVSIKLDVNAQKLYIRQENALQCGSAVGNGNLGDVDLNTVTQSGMYRFNVPTNGPSGVGYSQLLVIHGALDTITQIIGDYATGTLYTRSGAPASVGGSGSWTTWEKPPASTADYSSGLNPITAPCAVNTLLLQHRTDPVPSGLPDWTFVFWEDQT